MIIIDKTRHCNLLTCNYPGSQELCDLSGWHLLKWSLIEL